MAILLLDSVAVPVSYDVAMDAEDLTSQRPAFSGKIRTIITGDYTQARVWPIRTPLMTVAAADTIEAILIGANTVSASGDLIGSTVECQVLNISRQGGEASAHATLSFELHEVAA